MDKTGKSHHSALVIVCLLYLLQKTPTVYSVRMNIQPNSVQVGGQSSAPTAFPTSTPAEVVMDCLLDGGAEFVYALYMKRKRAQDYDFITFAEINSQSGQSPSLSGTAPADIRLKSPRLTGSTVSSNARLTARFNVDKMDCHDEAMYQCRINYKPSGYESRIENATSNLTVSVLPTLFMISASRVGVTYPQSVQNDSTVDINTDLEFTCSGGIGRSQSTLVDWYWRTKSYNSIFTRYTPQNNADINQGNPTFNDCSFTRTSTLRYRMSNDDWQGIMFRCGVAVPSNNGIIQTTYSPEFHIRPGNGFQNRNSGRPMKVDTSVPFLCVALWIVNHCHRRH